jgi:hypothetical protein
MVAELVFYGGNDMISQVAKGSILGIEPRPVWLDRFVSALS